MAKTMQDTEECWAEYEFSEDTLQLTVKKSFHPINDDFKIISRKHLERSQSFYKDYSDEELSDWDEPDDYEGSCISITDEESDDQLTAMNNFSFNKSAPPVGEAVKVEDQEFKPPAQLAKSAHSNQIHPFTQIANPAHVMQEQDQAQPMFSESRLLIPIHVVEVPYEFDEARNFLALSTRHTILSMINQFVYWKPFQHEYSKIYLKSFKKSLEKAGYEAPITFFEEYSDTFVVSEFDGKRILKVKDATEEELQNMLAVYKEDARTRYFKVDDGQKVYLEIRVDDSIQFKNIFYS